jgi:hypothetical protein
LADSYGVELKFEHFYPNYYRQAISNPQTSFCYPEDALGAFKRWLREVYVPQKLPLYLSRLVQKGKITSAEASSGIAALEQRDRMRSLPKAA